MVFHRWPASWCHVSNARTSPALSCCSELFVFDSTYTNVAFNKSTSSSGQYTLDPFTYTSGMGVNGVITMDVVGPSDMTYCAQVGTASEGGV